MNISLTPQLEKLIQEKVASGRYGSASEVIREALRLLDDQEKLYQIRLEELRREVQIGIDQADRGEFSDATPESIMERVSHKLERENDKSVSSNSGS